MKAMPIIGLLVVLVLVTLGLRVVLGLNCERSLGNKRELLARNGEDLPKVVFVPKKRGGKTVLLSYEIVIYER